MAIEGAHIPIGSAARGRRERAIERDRRIGMAMQSMKGDWLSRGRMFSDADLFAAAEEQVDREMLNERLERIEGALGL